MMKQNKTERAKENDHKLSSANKQAIKDLFNSSLSP